MFPLLTNDLKEEIKKSIVINKPNNSITYDKKEAIGKSIIYHGKHNDRIYISHLDVDDYSEVINRVDSLIKQEHYTKIFAKTPAHLEHNFSKNGFIPEGTIPNYYNGQSDVLFMCKYFSPERKFLSTQNKEKIDKIITLTETKIKKEPNKQSVKISDLNLNQMDALAQLYRDVFPSYPFPIFESSYLQQSLDSCYYYGVYDKNQLVAAASSEVNVEESSAEMTDFATLSSYRGQGFAFELLKEMERNMSRLGIKTVYTIARAISPGMNITFSKNAYSYGGLLVNNTNIGGQIESMNIWYKHL